MLTAACCKLPINAQRPRFSSELTVLFRHFSLLTCCSDGFVLTLCSVMLMSGVSRALAFALALGSLVLSWLGVVLSHQHLMISRSEKYCARMPQTVTHTHQEQNSIRNHVLKVPLATLDLVQRSPVISLASVINMEKWGTLKGVNNETAKCYSSHLCVIKYIYI